MKYFINRADRKRIFSKIRETLLIGRKAIVSSILISLILVPALLFASTIKGRVYDKTTDKSLAAANVMIEGTSFGAAADLEGMYIITNVLPGRQTLVVSYIGYVTVKVELDIPEYGTLKRDFGLQPDVVKGKEVIVLAQGLGQIQAINQQLASDKISNVVSEARIQELPDFNAAQALARLPGVSTLESSGEANKVVIRGLAPQYNTISVEGVKLASTGSSQIGVSALGNTSGSVSNDRSVDLSMVSPYMIKSMSVFKSLTPDMNANSIGGSVDMELREAPSKLHYDLLWQSGYTAKTGNYGNYRAVASVSQRIFQDKLGAYLLVNAEKYDRDADNMDAFYNTSSSTIDTTTGYRPVRVRDVTLRRHIETRKRYGGNLILDYNLPSGSIKAVNMFTRLASDYQDYNTILNYADELLNFKYREGINTTDLSANSIVFKYDFGRMVMDMQLSNTSSKNDLPESPYVELKTGPILTAKVTDNTIPDSLKQLIAFPGPGGVELDNINLFSSLYKESKTLFSSNFKFPFAVSTFLTGYVKIGGQYHLQQNSNDQKTPYASIRKTGDFQSAMVEDLEAVFGIPVDPVRAKFLGSSFMGSSDLLSPFIDNQFGEIYYVCDPTIPTAMAEYLANSPQWRGRATGGAEQTGGWYSGMFQTLANSYRYMEEYYATYIMSEIKYRNLMIVGGARYEKMTSKYTAYNMFDMRNPDAQDCDTVVAKPKSEFILPMVQAKYSPFKWFDIRYAYTQTLARPDYHQMSPKITYNNPRNVVRAGNPDLQPALAYNHDLYLTFHGNKLGLFSIGGFYKTVEDFTYSYAYRLHQTSEDEKVKTINDFDIMGIKPDKDKGPMLYTYINSPYRAFVKGLEFDLQTRFWYLPFPFDGVVLGANYTMIESRTRYPYNDEVTDYTTRPPVTTTQFATRPGRLIYQPNDVVNAYVGYEYKGFSARLSFLFQGNSVSRIGTFPEQDGYTNDYFRIDASIRQKLPWYGTEIYLDASNLNNAPNESAQITIDGFTNVKHYGATANLGVRFRL
ncbi:MAG TPA: TonB-dependent receptor [Candidatus Marinimicrobia bacterium]|nr:TonB-dependent receptor [Candidatus Neomarinimicrobiota bacterium]